MALGDLMASRFSSTQSSVAAAASAVVSNHYDDYSSAAATTTNGEDAVVGDLMSQRRDSDTTTSSYGNVSNSNNAVTVTSMAYLPQTMVLCELRHVAFEASVPTGPSDSGLVSKWRPKDRMKTGYVALVLCLNISVDPPDVIKISPCARMECWI
ncbi:conserved hypothetical protein, partial [Ricinus communis]